MNMSGRPMGMIARALVPALLAFPACGAGLFAPAGFEYAQPEGGQAEPAAQAPKESGSVPPIEQRPLTRRALEAAGPAGARVSFQTGFRHMFEADFDEGDGGADQGKVSINRASADLGFSIPLAENSFLDFGLGFERSWYDFDGATGFVPGVQEPWSDVNELGFSTVYRAGINDRWSYFVGGLIDASGEDGADFGDSLTYGGLLGVGYAASESLRLGLGVLVSSRIEDDAMVIPLPSVDWNINERLSLNIGGGRAGGELAYKLSDQWRLAIESAWESREFRLDEDNRAAPEGVGRDRRVPVDLAATWSPSRNVSLVGRVGYIVWQEFELRNRDGDDISEIEADPAPYVGASLRIAF